MNRILSSVAAFAFIASLGAAVDAKPCRDAHGKFMKCPPKTTTNHCRDKKTGKFIKCSSM